MIGLWKLMISISRSQRPGASAHVRRDFVLGDIVVDPVRHSIMRGSQELALEPRVMALLVYLSDRPLEIVSKHELIQNVWQANVVDEAVHRAVSLLRTALGDTPQRSTIIETVPRHGYRLLVMPTELQTDLPQPRLNRRWLAAAAIAATAMLLSSYAMQDSTTETHLREPVAVAKATRPPAQPVGSLDKPNRPSLGEPQFAPTMIVAREPALAGIGATPRATPDANPQFASPAPTPPGQTDGTAALASEAEPTPAPTAPAALSQ